MDDCINHCSFLSRKKEKHKEMNSLSRKKGKMQGLPLATLYCHLVFPGFLYCDLFQIPVTLPESSKHLRDETLLQRYEFSKFVHLKISVQTAQLAIYQDCYYLINALQ